MKKLGHHNYGTFSGFESMRVENLCFGYEGTDQKIFENLTMDIPLGKNILISGVSGSGQSTFLKLLAMLIEPQSGRLIINGQNVTEMSFEEFLPIRMRIGFSFDLGGLFANRTLHDNLVLPLLFHNFCSREEAEAKARELAKHFEFERNANQRPAMVSGGLRKLVCVLRSFMLEPEMLILDDPFTGIGTDASRKVIRMILDRKEAGQVKHIFLTSRDEVWPHWLGCDQLNVDRERVHFEERIAS